MNTLNCPHFGESQFENARQIISNHHKIKSAYNMVCLHCGFLGYNNSFRFQNHLLDMHHYYCMRIKAPIELYCAYCGDYQFNERVDKLLGRCRMLSPIITLLPEEHIYQLPFNIDANIIKEKLFLPRGMCNMGSTCFMSSVLQVLIHFDEIRNAFKHPIFENCTKPPMDHSNNDAILHGSNGCNGEINGKNSNGRSGITKWQYTTRGCIPCELKRLCEEAMLYPLEAGMITNSQLSRCLRSTTYTIFIITYFMLLAVSLPSIVPAYLLYSVWTHADYVAGYEQQDAHEFLVALLDGLDSHLRRYHGLPATPRPEVGTIDTQTRVEAVTETVNASPLTALRQSQRLIASSLPQLSAPNTKKYGLPTSLNVVKEILSGSMLSVVTCSHCRRRSSRTEPFLDLSLSLEGYNQAVDEDNGFIDNDYSGKINNGFAKQKKFIESNGTISGHNSNDVSDKELSKKRGRAESVSSVDGRRVNNGKAVSLYDCLEDFTYKETLTEPIDCETCHEARRSSKQLSLASTPSLLTIQLKRFHPVTRKKLSVHVDFPLVSLDLTPYLSQTLAKPSPRVYPGSTPRPGSASADMSLTTINGVQEAGTNCGPSGQCQPNYTYSVASTSMRAQTSLEKQANTMHINTSVPSPRQHTVTVTSTITNTTTVIQPTLSADQSDDQPRSNSQPHILNQQSPLVEPQHLAMCHAIYDLHGVVCHSGTLNQGHFISYVRSESQQWIRCDDDRVTIVDDEEVIASEGYLLFYRKRYLEKPH